MKKQNKRFTNAKTVKKLRDEGWLAENVEKFIAAIGHYRDLYLMWDVLGMKPGGGVLLVQSTTKGVLARHRAALLANSRLLFCLKSGARCQLWSWREVKGLPGNQTWEPRIEEAIVREGDIVEFILLPAPATS
jgi:hypothetical protein